MRYHFPDKRSSESIEEVFPLCCQDFSTVWSSQGETMEELIVALNRDVALRSVAICICVTPFVHAVSVAWHGLREGEGLFFWPFRGGRRAAAFQLLGWVRCDGFGVSCGLCDR
jgi:hypothetical protein